MRWKSEFLEGHQPFKMAYSYKKQYKTKGVYEEKIDQFGFQNYIDKQKCLLVMVIFNFQKAHWIIFKPWFTKFVSTPVLWLAENCQGDIPLATAEESIIEKMRNLPI